MAQNGLPSNYYPPPTNAAPSSNPQFNGVHSLQSSRNSSPAPNQLQQRIPTSQLPPSYRPPSSQQSTSNRPPINQIQQNLGQLNLNTPKSFTTSTPLNQTQNSAFSPFNSPKTGQNTSGLAPNPPNSVIPPPKQNAAANSAMKSQGQSMQFSVLPGVQNANMAPLINPGFSIASAAQDQNVKNLAEGSIVQRPPQLNHPGALLGPHGGDNVNNLIGTMPPMPQNQQNSHFLARKPVSMPPVGNNVALPPENFNNLLGSQQATPPMSQPQLVAPPRINAGAPNQFSAPEDYVRSNTGDPRPYNNYPPGMPAPQNLNQAPNVPPSRGYALPSNGMPPNRYPPSAGNSPYQGYQPQVAQTGFNRLWGQQNVDLLQNANVLPKSKMTSPEIHLGNEQLDSANCNQEVFRCTLTKIPENNSLLQKSRLPLGVLIHPFKDLTHLPVIQCNVIVRCRACRTYINPFVVFVDAKRWKCNLCYRINELPEEFQYDPVSKTYGDPSRRPEIKASTIEYIAPAEYMLRPPQPAVYLFLFDISRLAIESGYLSSVCGVLLDELDNLPGDARTQVGVIAYDSSVHFFSLAEGLSQPHEMTVLEIDDIFLPCPDNFLINLKDRLDMLKDLLTQLPNRYNSSYDNNSAMGAALQAAHKMMAATGGRVTVFQASLPNKGPGSLQPREDPSQRNAPEVPHLNPANDFYKRLALECSGQQIAVDLFLVNSQYVDVATISGISRFSGGCLHHFPLFKLNRVLLTERLERAFRRYLTRKIGFEAVMRVRCSRGLSIHTFHGNFFVRSTDLLSLPNINPDAGFGMQVAIEESLSDVQTVCFQAALLYTSSKGERRIRVHTLCLQVCATLSDVIHSADQQCIIGLLSKMAVDRSMKSSLLDAREAFINVAVDVLSSYKLSLNMGSGMSGLLAPDCLKLLPLYISALLKHVAFRTGSNTRLDDRVKAMIDMKTKPLPQLIQAVYPDLYSVHDLDEQGLKVEINEEVISVSGYLQLSARSLDSKGAFLLDLGEHMIVLVCAGVSLRFLNEGLGVRDYVSIGDDMYEIPVLENECNLKLHQFIAYLNDEKPFPATLHIIRDNSQHRVEFYERLIEDRMENALSYHEFLQHIKTQIK